MKIGSTVQIGEQEYKVIDHGEHPATKHYIVTLQGPGGEQLEYDEDDLDGLIDQGRAKIVTAQYGQSPTSVPDVFGSTTEFFNYIMSNGFQRKSEAPGEITIEKSVAGEPVEGYTFASEGGRWSKIADSSGWHRGKGPTSEAPAVDVGTAPDYPSHQGRPDGIGNEGDDGSGPGYPTIEFKDAPEEEYLKGRAPGNISDMASRTGGESMLQQGDHRGGVTDEDLKKEEEKEAPEWMIGKEADESNVNLSPDLFEGSFSPGGTVDLEAPRVAKTQSGLQVGDSVEMIDTGIVGRVTNVDLASGGVLVQAETGGHMSFSEEEAQTNLRKIAAEEQKMEVYEEHDKKPEDKKPTVPEWWDEGKSSGRNHLMANYNELIVAAADMLNKALKPLSKAVYLEQPVMTGIRQDLVTQQGHIVTGSVTWQCWLSSPLYGRRASVEIEMPITDGQLMEPTMFVNSAGASYYLTEAGIKEAMSIPDRPVKQFYGPGAHRTLREER